VVAACVAVYSAQVASGLDWWEPRAADMLAWGATYGPRTAGGEEWRLLTHLFLHGGLLHLAFNMWVLWDVGRFVERQTGPAAFLASYLAAGIAGGLASLAWHPHMTAVGASGAIFGLYGLVLGWLPALRAAGRGASWRGIGRGALLFVAFNLAFGATRPDVDNAAHVGGLLAGLAIGLLAGRALLAGAGSARRLATAGIAGGAAAVLAATVAFWPTPPDFQAQLDRFNALATRVFGEMQAISGDPKQPRAARTCAVIRRALPEWREIRMTLAGYGTPPADRAGVIYGVLDHMTLLEVGWTLYLEGVERHDVRKLRQAQARTRAALNVLETLPYQ
jgi:rhomboid protease GluP